MPPGDIPLHHDPADLQITVLTPHKEKLGLAAQKEEEEVAEEEEEDNDYDVRTITANATE